MNRIEPQSRLRGPLGIAGGAAAILGAAGSLVCTLRVGSRNPSRLLVGMFVVWVLSPFAALLWAHMASASWRTLTRATLYWTMIAVAVFSLVVYGYVAFGPPRPQPAFVFLAVPLTSWLLMLAAIGLATLVARGGKEN